MNQEYGFKELGETLQSSNYFESDENRFNGEKDEEVKFGDDNVEYDGRLYLEDEVSRLLEELEEEIDGFSRDLSVNLLREATSKRGKREFVIR